MPALIRELAIAGSHKSDGSANASGSVFLYEPGTTTIVPGYTDDTLSQAWTTSGGGIPLDAGGRVKIWINDMVDVVIADSDGGILDTMLGYNRTRAEQVEVENDNFTGAVTDSSGAVSIGLGGKTDLDTVLTTAAGSLGTDFKYKESSGATSQNYIEVIRQIQVTPQNFGALANGLHDDTTAITQAFNEIIRLGSGTVYFPPGNYLTSAGLALNNATGVNIRGSGATILCTSGSATLLQLTSCGQCSVQGIIFSPQSGTTGALVGIASSSQISIRDIQGSNASFGIDVSAGSFVSLDRCDISNANGAGGRALRSSCTALTVRGGRFVAGSGAAVEFTGAAARSTIIGSDFGGAGNSPTGVLFNSSLSGTLFDIIGCPGLGIQTLPIDVTGVTIDPRLRQIGNNADRISTSGAAHTPIVVGHNEIHLTGAGGAVTVNAPAVLPSASEQGKYWDFVFVNNAAGTTWNTNAIYVLSGAVAVPTTASHIVQVRFRWDPLTSKFRECSRGDTV